MSKLVNDSNEATPFTKKVQNAAEGKDVNSVNAEQG